MLVARHWLRALPLAAVIFLSPSSSISAQSPRAVDAGPTISAASAGVRRIAPAASLEAARESAQGVVRRGNGQAVSLMVVGGIAFVVGALVGNPAGPILMIGGAAAGLYGLYLYLQ